MNRETTYYGVIWVKHCINCNAVIYDNKAEICPICKKSINIFEPEKSLKAAEFNERLKVSSRILAALSYINLDTILLPMVNAYSLCYLPVPLIIVTLIALLFKKKDKNFIKYHALKGTIFLVIALFELFVLCRTPFYVISRRIVYIFTIIYNGIEYTDIIYSFIFLTIDITLFVISLINIIYALKGKK